MPRKPCYWTRKLELALVEFVRQRDFIWKPIGNTNHHIQQKYKAYAEFAAKLSRGFTARSVRDRWVNIRSTFNHNLRRVEKSKENAKTPSDVYVPCWPLWKPLQFLKDASRKEDTGAFENYNSNVVKEYKHENDPMTVKEEIQSDLDDIYLGIRQRGQRTDRPRHRVKLHTKVNRSSSKCKRVLDDLVQAMKPLIDTKGDNEFNENNAYWFFGKHVTERLNCMRKEDAKSACKEIMNLILDYDVT